MSLVKKHRLLAKLKNVGARKTVTIPTKTVRGVPNFA
jgi:hypothetical protein